MRSFDTDTRGLDWFEADQGPFLVTWSDQRGGDHLAHVTDKRAMAAFESDMKASTALVGHNVPFDVHQLREHCDIDLLKFGIPLTDTNLKSRVAVPERWLKMDDAEDDGTHGYKLKDLGTTYVDPHAKDTETAMAELARQAGIKLKEKNGYYDTWRAFPQAMEDYARNDTRLTVDLDAPLDAKLGSQYLPNWRMEQTLQPWLIRAEAQGIRVDQDKVAPLKISFTEQQDRAYDAIVSVLGAEAVGDPNDPEDKDSHPALRDALLAHGVPLHRKVNSCKHADDAGCDCALATNKFALKEFEREFPVISDIFKLRQASKFLATYIGPMEGRDVVHPSFWQIGAKTHRMSCSRPNMQNIPVRGEGASELRAMFIPRPGHCFVVTDFDAIEVRFLAHYLGSKGAPYRQMILDGFDVHSWMASKIWGGTPAEYAKGGPKDKLRSLAKNILFAIVYGAGAPRVMDMLADAGMPCSRPAAKSLISAIKRSLPGYYAITKRVRNKVEHYGYINTIMGRKLPVKKDKAYVGFNALIQGSAAEAFKQAIINVNEAVFHLGALTILFCHDELVTECPIEYAEECRVLQEAAMLAALDLNPPLLATSHICMNNYSEGK